MGAPEPQVGRMKRETTLWITDGPFVETAYGGEIVARKVVVIAYEDKIYVKVYGTFRGGQRYTSTSFDVQGTRYRPMPDWLRNLIWARY